MSRLSQFACPSENLEQIAKIPNLTCQNNPALKLKGAKSNQS